MAARSIAEFINSATGPRLDDIVPIARVVIDEFASGRVDAVYLIYTEFVNTLVAAADASYQLLPLQPAEATGQPQPEYIYEPSPAAVLAAARAALHRERGSTRRCSSRSPASRAPAWSPCATRPRTRRNWCHDLTLSLQQAAPGQDHPRGDRNRRRRGGADRLSVSYAQARQVTMPVAGRNPHCADA